MKKLSVKPKNTLTEIIKGRKLLCQNQQSRNLAADGGSSYVLLASLFNIFYSYDGASSIGFNSA